MTPFKDVEKQKSQSTKRTVTGNLLLCVGCSQAYITPAFLAAYFILTLCKAVDNPSMNLAMLVPWYGYALIYVLFSLAALTIVISKWSEN